MTLSSTSRPAILGRVLTRLPATLAASGGLQVVKANGIWTFSPDWTVLNVLTTLPDPESKQLWVLDPNTEVYSRLSVSALMSSAFTGTSTTSLSVATGSNVFTTQAGKLWALGQRLRAASDDGAIIMEGEVTAYSSTSLTISVDRVEGSGTHADWNISIAGSPGQMSPIPGIRQLYDSATTDADPGDGDFRLNHATPSSATAAYLDNLDTAGGTVSPIIDKWDDSTTTTKGFLRIEKESDATVWAEYTVTGSAVDGTGYRKLTLSAGSSNGTFTAGDAFRISFSRAGDKGSDGANGSGTFPGSSTDNAIPRFDGTAGSTVQNSGVTIDDSNNVAGIVTIELGHATDTTLSRSAAGVLAVEGVSVLTTGTGVAQGKHTIWIPASAMKPRASSGAGTGTYDSGTNDITSASIDFDTTSQEYAHTIPIGMPKSWNEGTVTAQAYWTNTGGTAAQTVRFTVAGLAVSDDDTLNGTFGTTVNIDDTCIAQNDLHISAESGAITIGGSPAEGDLVIFQISRDVANDTMAGDANLLGIKVFITTNAATDA